MQLRIRSPHLELSAETRSAVDHKLRLALGRHVAAIEAVHVTVSTHTDPRLAGRGWRCRAHLRLRADERLVVEDQAESVRAAADAVAWRLAHRLDRRRSTLPRAGAERGRSRIALR